MSNTPEPTEQSNEKTIFGFWVYLMTDCVLFATLFATYAVLQHNTAGGADAKELFSLPYVLVETMLLLVSSYTSGLMLLSARAGNKRAVFGWLAATVLLGLGFLGMEFNEFHKLAAEGSSWNRSGFLSAFFTLIGTHGLHIATGLLWAVVMGLRIAKTGLTNTMLRRLTLFSMFWHFLDIVWICIFTFVYLLGVR